MTKFRKLPIEVEAEKFIYSSTRWPEGVYASGRQIFVQTVNGPVEIENGEWIITGVNGEHYPCKPDIFTKTYEMVIDPLPKPTL